MELIQKELARSSIYNELRWKYLEKKLRLPVLLAIICMTAWIAQMSWATAELASNLVYYVR